MSTLILINDHSYGSEHAYSVPGKANSSAAHIALLMTDAVLAASGGGQHLPGPEKVLVF